VTQEEYAAAVKARAAEAARERARAETLWQRLQACGDREARKNLVLGDPEFQSFGLCEKLCHESAELAEDDAESALELASLALKLAPRVDGDKYLRAGMQGYAWEHLGNVLRARGDLAGAQRAFEEGEKLVLASFHPVLPGYPFRHDRRAALKAALLRDQGKLAEAVSLLSGSTAFAGDDKSIASAAHLERGRLRRQLGRVEAALEDLSWAARDARSANALLLARIEIERGHALCDLDRHGEVKKLPATLRKAAEGDPLERARLRCLQGRVAAGLGHAQDAEAALRKGHSDLHERAAADLVLLALELAALYTRQGETAKLKGLAEKTQRLAGLPTLGREAVATLKLFCRLAAQEKLSLERALQFAKDFSRISAGHPR